MFSLTSFDCAQCKLCTEWIQYGLWPASFGGMNRITSRGLSALAQARCQYAELTMALFKKKALCLFENKILAHGQRSVYTHWTSLSSCYGIPFTRPLKQSSEEVLNASSEYTQKQGADVKMAQPYIFIW